MTYDLMGQVTVRGKDRLVWDVWGRLVEVSNETYTWTASYDAFGRRLQTSYTSLIKGYLWNSKGKSTITTSLYDPEEEFLEIGVISAGKTFWKLYGNSSCDAIVDNKGKTSILTHDIKDNLINVISSEDVQWASYYPSPYGPLDPGSVEFTPDSLTWQSKRSDPTGLIWMGARYYDPREGCFLSPDPISYPVCLDLYTYANGDPINNFDPDGRYASPILKDIGTTVADVFFSNRFQGSMRAMGGLTEAIAGGSFALASLETGIGAVAGFAVMAHGLDNFQAGFHQVWNNVSRDPATVQLLQKAGMSHNASHMTNDVGMMLATMGAVAGVRVASKGVPHFRLPSKGYSGITNERVVLNFTDTAGKHMYESGRKIPIHILNKIIKSPMAVVKDPQATSNAMMHYSQVWKNGKLYNAEVLYDKTTNMISHFQYTQKPIGPLKYVRK
ncbi:MAG: RHS repeat-associated core domain-containing protein [Parachlamydiaceae bacterium]